MKLLERYNTRRKFENKNLFIIPDQTYKIKPWRKRMINKVNRYVKMGLCFYEIAKLIDRSPGTVKRYYYGYADNFSSSDSVDENLYKRFGSELFEQAGYTTWEFITNEDEADLYEERLMAKTISNIKTIKPIDQKNELIPLDFQFKEILVHNLNKKLYPDRFYKKVYIKQNKSFYCTYSKIPIMMYKGACCDLKYCEIS